MQRGLVSTTRNSAQLFAAALNKKLFGKSPLQPLVASLQTWVRCLQLAS